MIKLISLAILLFSFVNSPTLNLETIRKDFYNATEDKKSAELFKEKLKKIGEGEPVLLGYRGMSEMIMANYSYNPISKISYFTTGKEFLEKAIQLAPQNAELRFLRFTIQTNAPFFLGYKSDIETDKQIIINYLKTPSQDEDLEKRLKDYLLQSRYCTEDEKNLIK